jgi:hypothetical protein
MGHWNNGMLEYWVWRNEIYFYIDGPDRKVKSGHHPLFIPNIPFFHHSMGYLMANTTPLGVKSKPDALGQDSLLLLPG